VEVRAALPEELQAIAEWLFGDGVAVDHFLQAIAKRSLDPAHVLVALKGDGLCGAVVAEPLPGKLSVVLPPRANDPATADALIEAALDHVRSFGVRLAQAYLDPPTNPAAFERNGFHFATRIEKWVCDVGEPQRSTGPKLCFTSDFDLATFRSTLLATFEGSLDAPEANIGATAEEIDGGYAANCERWLALEDGRPLGVSILSQIADSGVIEYLGVVPAARHRGIGRAILNHAVNTFHDMGVKQISVSVDARNQPARALYDRLGFRPVRTQNLWLLRLPRTA
jgi:ribosomal protein S18 acetylase RimI-like enzyme